MTYPISDRSPTRVRSTLKPVMPATAPSVWTTKEWAEMQVAIADALQPHAEAWDAVAKALREHHLKYADRHG